MTTATTPKARAAELVGAEIDRAEALWGKGYASAHEAFAVLLEEVDEFKVEVWKRRGQRDRVAMVKELVQIAAVAQRYCSQLLEGAPEIMLDRLASGEESDEACPR